MCFSMLEKSQNAVSDQMTENLRRHDLACLALPLSRFEDFLASLSYEGECWKAPVSGTQMYSGIMHNLVKLAAHRLSLVRFVGLSQDWGMFCLHKCGVKNCVRPSHLYWGTGKQNAEDAHADMQEIWLGRRGSGNPGAKLTDGQVIEIWKACCLDKRNNKILAKKYNVTEGTISGIRHVRCWQNLLGPLRQERSAALREEKRIQREKRRILQ
jgi:hypothetical protein